MKKEIMMENIIQQVSEAYRKHRAIELRMKACPNCQFEQFENGKCEHCKFTINE